MALREESRPLGKYQLERQPEISGRWFDESIDTPHRGKVLVKRRTIGFDENNRERVQYKYVEPGQEDAELEEQIIISDDNTQETGRDKVLLAGNHDLTIHFELDVNVDLKPALEIFSGYTRIGDFRSARKYFEDNLQDYIDEPYVFLCYAVMLLDMGNYKELAKLEFDFQGLEDELESRTLQVFEEAWNVIQACLNLRLGKSETTLDRPGGVDLGYPNIDTFMESTQVHLIYLLARNMEVFHRLLVWLSQMCLSYMSRESAEAYTNRLIWELQSQGRIWEVRDIVIARSLLDGYNDSGTSLLDRDEDATVELCDQLFAKVNTSHPDLKTSLFLLDFFTNQAIVQRFRLDTLPDAQELISRAQIVAESMTSHHPSALKSRQYAQWILAKVSVSTYQETIFRSQLPGLWFSETNAMDLPVYIPIQREKPASTSILKQSSHTGKIELALDIARQMEDYHTEAMCLKQLILSSPEPKRFFDELVHLQREVQNDFHGYLRSLFAKYSLFSNDGYHDNLREEILALKDRSGMKPFMLWARCMILRALARTEDEAGKMLKEAQEFYGTDIPKVDELMEANDLVTKSVRRQRTSFDFD